VARECLVDANWIVPAIPELKVVERDGRWLCLNPEVPAWICTTKPSSLVLKMANGSRSVREYHELMSSHGIEAPLAKLIEFFQSAVDAKLFERPEQGGSTMSWGSRKLTALYLHITNRCNLQCSYCYRESSPHLTVLHDSGKFCEMLEYIQPFAVPRMEVTFSGGEPLMHPGFKEIVETSSRLGYRNLLLTNGTLLTDDMASFLATHFRWVKVSLDGPNDEIHARTRGKGNFSRVIRNVERLARRDVRVVVQVTLTKSSLLHANEIKTVLPDLPTIAVRFTPLLPMGRGTEMESEYIDNGEFYEFSKGQGLGLRCARGRRNRGCHAGAGSLSIAENGDVYPCHLFHSSEFHFGNIFHDPFEEIFFGEKVKAFARSMDVEQNNPVCRDCELRFLCAGGCHANTLHATGDYHGVDTFCSYQKRVIYDALFASSVPQAGARLDA
jgi:radical SAM protein with 4Fe4S-binding SPASM domain